MSIRQCRSACFDDAMATEEEKAQRYREIAKALGDDTRFHIIEMLKRGEGCACVLLNAFDFTQPALSYHMRSLRSTGLVIMRKEGTRIMYTINCETLRWFANYTVAELCPDAQDAEPSNTKEVSAIEIKEPQEESL